MSPWLASRGRPPWASPPSLDLRAIVAMGQHSRLIGCGGDLPWDLPEVSWSPPPLLASTCLPTVLS